MTSEIPRRIDMGRWIAAERAIYDAVQAVEQMPADVRLTDAVVLLQAARDAVADYQDGISPKRRYVREELAYAPVVDKNRTHPAIGKPSEGSPAIGSALGSASSCANCVTLASRLSSLTQAQQGLIAAMKSIEQWLRNWPVTTCRSETGGDVPMVLMNPANLQAKADELARLGQAGAATDGAASSAPKGEK